MSNNSYISSSKILNLHNSESINDVQVKLVDGTTRDYLIYSCSDSEINIYNTLDQSRKVLFNGSGQSNVEINKLKLSKDHLYAANLEYLQVFDVNTCKELNNYKISRETLNSIEISQDENLIACSDDLGEIKILDLRAKNVLSNKKVLKKHENICYTLKFNPFYANELFSGSFDSTICKWDLRMSTCVNRISVSETLQQQQQQQQQEEEQNEFLSTMTPCFVHTLCLTSLNDQPLLLAGIENGRCLAFNANTCSLVTQKQVNNLNCALTSLQSINETSLNKKFQSYLKLVNSNEIFISSGSSLAIEFFFLNNKSNDMNAIKIEKLNKFKIDHGAKINYPYYMNNDLFICDTTSDLTIYNLDVLCKDCE